MKKRFNFFTRKDSKGIVVDYLPWILIAIAVLAIILISIFILRGKGISLIDKIKDLVGGN